MEQEALKELVREDIRCHRENGVDLNPFSTDGKRCSWQAGFDGKPATSATYMAPYQRGQVARQIIEAEQPRIPLNCRLTGRSASLGEILFGPGF